MRGSAALPEQQAVAAADPINPQRQDPPGAGSELGRSWPHMGVDESPCRGTLTLYPEYSPSPQGYAGPQSQPLGDERRVFPAVFSFAPSGAKGSRLFGKRNRKCYLWTCSPPTGISSDFLGRFGHDYPIASSHPQHRQHAWPSNRLLRIPPRPRHLCARRPRRRPVVR